MKNVKLYGGRRSGCSYLDEIDGYEYVLERVSKIEDKVDLIMDKIDNLESRVKDIDMDLNTIYDDVEGNYENNNK